MLRYLPFLLAIAYGLVVWRFSTWRTKAELDARSTELLDPGLRPLIDRMAAALDLPKLRVFLYEIAPVNGLAAPDGRIFLTRGFYDRYLAGDVTAEELASVVAHELGHVALGHTRRRMIDFSGQNAVRMALAAVLGRILPGIGVWLANLVTTMLVAHLSRGDEFEADAYATALLLKSGIGAEPQLSLFRKLDALAGNGGTAPAWLLTHPRTADRITAIEANARKWQPGTLT